MAIQHFVKRYTLPEKPEAQQITDLENKIICALRSPQPLTLGQLAKQAGSSIPSVKAVLAKMIKRNLVSELRPSISQAQAA